MYRFLFLSVASLLAAGCASTPSSQRVRADHPASADAASSPMPAATGTLSQTTPSGSPPSEPMKPLQADMGGMPGMAGMSGMSQPSASTAYVCPMHPEVTSNAPGKCPKCGMKLVAKGGE